LAGRRAARAVRDLSKTKPSSGRLTSWRGASRSRPWATGAGVFDEEKLAWVNRHYLKMAEPARIADLAVPYFVAAGVPHGADRGEVLAFSRRRGWRW